MAEAQTAREQLVSAMRAQGAFADARIEAAFAAVPRHVFLPGTTIEQAYEDKAIPTKRDANGLVISSASQPTMIAIMLRQLGLQPGDNVLEIGTATGYNAALMSRLVGPTGRVTSIELDIDLARQAESNLQRAGYGPVTVVQQDGALGYAPRASYDHIISTVGVWDIPHNWRRQLRPTGSLVAPIWLDGVQVSARFVPQADGTLLSADNRPCAFVYIRGGAAGPNFRKQIGSTSLYLITEDVDDIDPIRLHTLLSDDHTLQALETRLSVQDYWYGFQLYAMLNHPHNVVFAMFAVIEGQKAYGLEGNGLALLSPASAAFAPYQDRGNVHAFAGADAFLILQDLLDGWVKIGHPHVNELRLRLIPRDRGRPEMSSGRVFERQDHFLHVWMDPNA